MISGATIRLFLSLKWTLTRNGMRGSRGRTLSLIVSWALAGFIGLLLMLSPARLNTFSDDDGWALSVPLVLVLAASWAVMPLIFPNVGDEAVDVTRLALLPLRPQQLIGGLLAASFVAIGPFVGLLLLTGLAVGTARHPAAALVAAIAVPLTLMTFIVFRRAVATANTALLTSRRGRERVVASAIGLVLVWELFVNVGRKKLEAVSLEDLVPISRWLEWVPPGSALRRNPCCGRQLLHPGRSRVVVDCSCAGRRAVVAVQFGNTFGYDRSGFWIVLHTNRTRADARRELLGRLLARAVVAVPYLLILTSVVAALSRRWRNCQRRWG
ncbi:hypothetical protein [Nocardia jiangxiensis]|uniref:hypothetical protein n=1 Tax=Nocardia jiangxiensis TaxID=282685 RepID=UPI000592BA24|nr:hypothetical protein [Nocardia jiangxiensis]